MFYFNNERFDCWPIFTSITRLYPLGIKKYDSGGDAHFFCDYPGYMEYAALLEENINDEERFQSRWVRFEQSIAAALQLPVIGTTYGQAPSFSASVVLSRENAGPFTRVKELHFFVSLTGPFYTVMVVDQNEIIEEHTNFRTCNCLVVSPEQEFADLFTAVSTRIEQQFTGFRFVPFCICKQIIDGLEVYYSDAAQNNVFNAIFSSNLNLNVRIEGRDYFKIEDWEKPDYKRKPDEWKGSSPYKTQ